MPVTAEDTNLFFQLISKKYEKSLIITTNKNFSEWGKVFKDEVVAATILDRLLHHSPIFKMPGKSYRLKEKKIDMEKKKDKIKSAKGGGKINLEKWVNFELESVIDLYIPVYFPHLF